MKEQSEMYYDVSDSSETSQILYSDIFLKMFYMLMLRTPLFYESKYGETLILVYGVSTTVLWPLLRGLNYGTPWDCLLEEVK